MAGLGYYSFTGYQRADQVRYDFNALQMVSFISIK